MKACSANRISLGARPIGMGGWRRSTSAGANHGPAGALGAAEREVEWAIFSSG
jgi:hypothetical protein